MPHAARYLGGYSTRVKNRSRSGGERTKREAFPAKEAGGELQERLRGQDEGQGNSGGMARRGSGRTCRKRQEEMREE